MEYKVRLFLDQPLVAEQVLPLDEGQANYLFNVMRLVVGDVISVFNGRDGEWTAEVVQAAKRKGLAVAKTCHRAQEQGPDLWLIFAPIKKARLDFIVEKAVELGVSGLQPVQTRYTNGDRIRHDRMQAQAVEAAEQCEAIWVPKVGDLMPLDRLLAGWDPARQIFWAAERSERTKVGFPSGHQGPAAVLIGPEGGFSPEEKAKLSGLPFVTPISLGPRILRAETAAVAALVLWQATCGDWR